MAVTEREVMAALGRVRLPAGVAGMVASEAVRRVSINGTAVRVWLEVSSSQPVDVDALRAESVAALRTVDGVERADVEVDLQIQLAAAAGPRPAAEAPAAPAWAERIPGVRNVVVVASGKGGSASPRSPPTSPSPSRPGSSRSACWTRTSTAPRSSS